MTLLDDAQAIQADLVQLRRTLHREPEIGSNLPAHNADAATKPAEPASRNHFLP